MEKRTHNFLKGLGILFAVAAGIGTAVLGYVDRTDWIQVAFYSVAVVAIIRWSSPSPLPSSPLPLLA